MRLTGIQRDIELGREGWRTSTHVEAVIRSDADTFYSDITLTAKSSSAHSAVKTPVFQRGMRDLGSGG